MCMLVYVRVCVGVCVCVCAWVYVCACVRAHLIMYNVDIMQLMKSKFSFVRNVGVSLSL